MLLVPPRGNFLGSFDGLVEAVNGFLPHLNGFLVSFPVAGAVFLAVSPASRMGATETKSLAVFFHPSLD